jgi:hypothetical protein
MFLTRWRNIITMSIIDTEQVLQIHGSLHIFFVLFSSFILHTSRLFFRWFYTLIFNSENKIVIIISLGDESFFV